MIRSVPSNTLGKTIKDWGNMVTWCWKALTNQWLRVRKEKKKGRYSEMCAQYETEDKEGKRRKGEEKKISNVPEHN